MRNFSFVTQARSAKPPIKIPGFLEAQEEINVDSVEHEGDNANDLEGDAQSCTTADDLVGMATSVTGGCFLEKQNCDNDFPLGRGLSPAGQRDVDQEEIKTESELEKPQPSRSHQKKVARHRISLKKTIPRRLWSMW